MTIRWTFQGIISLIISAVVLIPLILTGFLLWYLLSPGIERQQLRSQSSIAEAVSQQVNVFLASGTHEIKLFARYIENQNKSDLDQQLNSLANLSGLFEVIYLVDQNGTVHHSGAPDSSSILPENLDHLDISRMKHFVDISEGRVNQWSESFLSSASGELVVAYSVAIENAEEYQYLIAEMGIQTLPELLQDIQSSSNLTVMILDNANQLIGYPDPVISRQQINLSNIALLSAPVGEFGQIGQFNFLEQDFYGALIDIPSIGWKIIVASPARQFWELFLVALRSIGIAIAIASIAVIILSRWISLLADRFFSQYRDIAYGLASGNYEFEPPSYPITELQSFGKDLISTGEAIAQRERELALINTELEQRVKDRTLDLSNVNQDLQSTLERLQRAQTDLVESGKLAALGSLVAGVSHELNTPIGVSVTAISSVIDEAAQLQSSFEANKLSRQDFADRISHITDASILAARNLGRASDLIQSFKQVSVDQSNDMRRHFILGDVLNDVVATLKTKFKNKHIKLSINIEDQIRLDSFPGSLIQVVSNLIDNAVVHGYADRDLGNIQLIASLRDPKFAEIQVIDDGNGISEENVNRIFEPFFTTRLGRGGSGLGLSIVHSIVKKILGGTIRVSSTVGKGTHFSVVIPLEAPVDQPELQEILGTR